MNKLMPLTREHLDEVTRIHMASLKNDFLPSLGFNFLKSLYQGVIGNKDVYGFVVQDNRKIIGFIIGTKNMGSYLKTSLLSNFMKISFYLVLRLVKKPTLVKNVLETLTYSSKDVGPPAELVVIAITSKYRNRGIGKKLVKALEQKFRREKINKYKLTVHADKKAVYFYEKLGYYRFSQFNLYNKPWYVYTKKFSKN